ncbi:hypothetical protein PCIT_a2723 [Pseudoalteromonas citrea]|uniref:WD40-like Beta Propeller Repeat n=2 Tax=Pseudoalteromonas citrea TaxID=43655 RepID=A0AAD4AHH3_9GAMM|nr:hypothetical protein [Pseudoalteromonas citrea]KAF7769817.1 hypothetical protein PCIT_a2723 [Pseudoalteromonas citrea]
MKRTCISTFLLLSTLTMSGNCYSKNDLPAFKDIYLGQKPPGLTPEPFAPDMLDKGFRSAAVSFSPDLKELYFRRRGGEYKKNTLCVIKYKNNQWIESVVPPRAGQPFVSVDGNTLHLGNMYRERVSSGWGEVKSLGVLFKDLPIMRLTSSATGTHYFDEATEVGNIRYSKVTNGKRSAPKSVSKAINAGKWTAHPFIAPDESYIIWDSERKEGQGDSDLYVSFRQQNGAWGPAINLGNKVNTQHQEQYGSITPDGKYFFFNRSYGGDNADIYWVDAGLIKALKPKF